MKGIDLVQDIEIMENIDSIEIEEKDIVEIVLDSNLKISCELFTTNWEYELITIDGEVERDTVENIESISDYFSESLSMDNFNLLKKEVEDSLTIS